MPTNKLTPEIIHAAIAGFEQQKLHIDNQINDLRAMLTGSNTKPVATPEAPTRKRKKFSAAARKRMKEAQQLRWAKIRGESEPPAPATPAKPKRKLSKAGKAAIVAALKKRWALKRAEAAKSKPAAAKKAAPKKAAVKRVVAKKVAAKKTAKVPAQTAAAEGVAQ